MELTRKDRWLLANQFRILELLDRNASASLARVREAIEQGYENHYSDYAEHILDGENVMSVEECREAVFIMSMFDAMRRHISQHKLPAGVAEWQTRFKGFDANHPTESKYRSYAEWYCAPGKFSAIKPDDFNSHSEMLSTYRRMLVEWNKCNAPENLTVDDVQRVAGAAIHPDLRK